MQALTFPTTPAVASPEAAAWQAAAVDAPDEAALHTASLQAAARPQAVVVAEAPRAPDPTQPAAELAKGFALPADQLLPVTLIGLQVQPGDAWPTAAAATDLRWPRRDDEAAPRQPKAGAAADGDDGAGDDSADDSTDGPEAGATDPIEVIDDAAADWQDALARAINERLAAQQPPAALRAAAEQWSRARCVVLVCPQGGPAVEAGVAAAAGAAGRSTEPAPEPAWAFVLWPRRTPRPRGPMATRFAFSGQRVPARLQWAPAPLAPAWCQVRAVKEHQPRTGRRLVALDAGGAPIGPVPCELQLGPVRSAPPRWRLAAVRLDAVQRFWTALGGQWSVLLLVCPQPLLVRPLPQVVQA